MTWVNDRDTVRLQASTRNRLFHQSCASNRLPRLPRLRETDHLLGFNVPNFQPETTKDFNRIERRSLGRLQLGYAFENFRQPIKWDSGVQMMNVVVTDIGG